MDTAMLKQQIARVSTRIIDLLKKLIFIFPPIIVLLVTLSTFRLNGLYPYGTKTISWCDMDQQVIPLLIDFKDILSGKEGFFFSFKNAGGMNFYGVFFFFLSSPFSFLVAFVPKAEIISFANVLVLLKMCAIACTASLYFKKKHPDNPLLNVFLSVLYAYSGYVMMYYQNVIWLDVVYLFPLLLLGLEHLKEGKKILFICALTACVVVNYYLSYMVVVFLLLYVGLWLWLSKDRKFAVSFTISCILAALLSAVVWMPSLIQYFTSGRTTSILDNLRSSSIFTAYETTFPTVFSILFLMPFALLGKKEDKDNLMRRVLFVAALVPIVLEPINKMWQTGSYMSFPTRYGFITIFLCLTLAMDGMAKEKKTDTEASATAETEETEATEEPKPLPLLTRIKQNWKLELPRYAVSVVCVLLAVWYLLLSKRYTLENVETMDQYSHSLWGNESSFEALLKLYVIALMFGLLWYILHRYKLFKPVFLWLSVGVMVLSELYVAPMTYMLTPAHEVDWHADVMEMADVIEDDNFYRVKTDKGYSGRDFDMNLMGSLGYNGLGHYTSLTSERYMTAIKQFGYTSYWMEVGNSGGTLLTDALMSIKYQIKHKNNSEGSIHKGEYYQIDALDYTLPLGVLAKSDIVKQAETEDYSHRAQLQETLYHDFFDDNGAVKAYGLEVAEFKNLTVTELDGKYVLEPKGTGSIVFKVPIQGTETVYFNAFDENTNALNQRINEKFTVSSQNITVSKYPQQRENGLLCLGEFSTGNDKLEKTIAVSASVKEKVTVRDLGVVTINDAQLKKDVLAAKTVGLTAGKNSLEGICSAEGGECVFLSIAYDSGMTLRINGKEAALYEVYDGFTAFYLQPGLNKIEISYQPKGFAFGLGLTLLGLGGCLALAALWIWKKYTLKIPKIGEETLYWAWISAGAFIVVIVYMVPLFLCAVG